MPEGDIARSTLDEPLDRKQLEALSSLPPGLYQLVLLHESYKKHKHGNRAMHPLLGRLYQYWHPPDNKTAGGITRGEQIDAAVMKKNVPLREHSPVLDRFPSIRWVWLGILRLLLRLAQTVGYVLGQHPGALPSEKKINNNSDMIKLKYAYGSRYDFNLPNFNSDCIQIKVLSRQAVGLWRYLIAKLSGMPVVKFPESGGHGKENDVMMIYLAPHRLAGLRFSKSRGSNTGFYWSATAWLAKEYLGQSIKYETVKEDIFWRRALRLTEFMLGLQDIMSSKRGEHAGRMFMEWGSVTGYQKYIEKKLEKKYKSMGKILMQIPMARDFFTPGNRLNDKYLCLARIKPWRMIKRARAQRELANGLVLYIYKYEKTAIREGRLALVEEHLKFFNALMHEINPIVFLRQEMADRRGEKFLMPVVLKGRGQRRALRYLIMKLPASEWTVDKDIIKKYFRRIFRLLMNAAV